jgi:hypothetical protein
MTDYRAAARMDAEIVWRRHQPHDEDVSCRMCGEQYPCGPARMAERALVAFERRGIKVPDVGASGDRERSQS